MTSHLKKTDNSALYLHNYDIFISFKIFFNLETQKGGTDGLQNLICTSFKLLQFYSIEYLGSWKSVSFNQNICCS